MYAVSSNPGCTVINGDMAVDVPAGGQSVILALDKKLIIDGDDNAKFVEVRWGTNAAVGSRPIPWMSDVVDGLVSIVGEANFDINYIPAENKLYLAFAYDTTEAQIAEVENLLERVLPQNVVFEHDPFPLNYTRVEYLENAGVQRILTDYTIKANSGLSVEFSYYSTKGAYVPCGCNGTLKPPTSNSVGVGFYFDFHKQQGYLSQKSELDTKYKASLNFLGDLSCALNEEVHKSLKVNWKESFDTKFWLFAGAASFSSYVRLYNVKISEGSDVVRDFVPALDSTGAPCMFDLVSRKPFYNVGTGDFLYPTESTTYSLRRVLPDWGKLTEHGLRRLYRVPEGYKGELIDYAEQNGYKPIVESEMPEEGYWTPVWHDREDCIELEWVETEEPPLTKEELQIEEIENA
jgi:hypothetical protein